jgi:hypothetical protein
MQWSISFVASGLLAPSRILLNVKGDLVPNGTQRLERRTFRALLHNALPGAGGFHLAN